MPRFRNSENVEVCLIEEIHRPAGMIVSGNPWFDVEGRSYYGSPFAARAEVAAIIRALAWALIRSVFLALC
jgi:hypothetical protein